MEVNKRMKKIAYVISRFPTISETFILYEILELQRLGFDVAIFPFILENETVKHTEVEALMKRVRFFHPLGLSTLQAQFTLFFKKPGAYLRVLWRVLTGNLGSFKFFSRALVVFPLAVCYAIEMRKLGVEHVHAHWATHPALAAYVIRELTGIPYSFTAHAHDIYVNRLMLDEKIKSASFLATISDYNHTFLKNLYGEVAGEKTAVVRCGVNIEKFSLREKRRFSDPLKIICVASLKDYKGHRYLLDACVLLRDKGMSFECRLVGDGELRSEIEGGIEYLGLAAHVKMLGFQPSHRLQELLDEADVMVLPSVVTATGKKEGIPVALMEALSVGLPVIVTAISGIPELVIDGETGFLVPERNANAIATAVTAFKLSPELAEKFRSAGRKKIEQEYNLATNVGKLAVLLNKDWPTESGLALGRYEAL